MMWGGYGGGWMAPLMGVSALLWWVLVVALVVAVVWWVLWVQWVRAGSTAAPDAGTILDARFARGEIDADEYAERRRLLTGG